MALPITWDAIPAYLTVMLTIGLAVVLLYLDFHKRANRAFALLLFLRGISLLVVTLRNAATTSTEFEFFQRMIPYFQIPQVPALLYFILVYPRARTWLGRSSWGGWALLGITLGLEFLYAINHGLYWTYDAGRTTSALLNAGGAAFGGFYYTNFGPFLVLTSLSVPMTCLVAAVLARDYLREKPGRARFSMVLMISAFMLTGLFFGTQYLVGFAREIADPAGFPWLPWGWAFAILPTLTLPLAGLALAVVWNGSRRTLDRNDDREATRLLMLSPIPLAWALGLSLASTDVFGDSLAKFSIGVWRLVMPLLVTYALLRYRLFDLDVKARLTIHYGTIAAAFGLVFFVGGELAEGFVSDWLGAWAGDWGGLVAAGILALAIKPVEKASGRFAKRIMPSATPLREMNEKERHTLYHDQFAMALQDGRLTASERRMLAELQAKLGLPSAKSSGSSADVEDRTRTRAAKTKAGQ